MSDLLLYLDPMGNILDINNAAVKMVGLEKKKIVFKFSVLLIFSLFEGLTLLFSFLLNLQYVCLFYMLL